MGAVRAHAVVPGALTAALGAIGLRRPGLWGDEFVTWGVASLSWRQTGRLLDHVDAVIGPYYAAMHLWTRVAGDGDVALRAPSVAAMAAAAALVGAIGARIAGPRVGLLGGTVFAGLPVVSRYAQEARPYAFAVLFATLATYLLVDLLVDQQIDQRVDQLRGPSRRRRGRLVAYALAVGLTGLAHLVGLLVLLAHGAAVVARRAPGGRRLVAAWLAAAGAGVLITAPVLVMGVRQHGQIGWISTVAVPPRYYLACLGGSVPGGVLMGLLALSGRAHRRPAGRLLAAWALLPPLALLAAAPVIALALPRYLLFTLPAWALLAGAGLARLRLPWALAAALTLAALAVPQQVAIRGAAGHEYAASRDLAATIARHHRPGDAIVYARSDGEDTCCGWVARDALAHYVPASRRPRDLYLRVPPRVDGQFGGVEYPVEGGVEYPVEGGVADGVAGAGEAGPGAGARLAGVPRLWVVRLGEHRDPLGGLGDGKEPLVRSRFRPAAVWHPTGFTVALLVAVAGG